MIVLITSLYKAKSVNRIKEYDRCLKENFNSNIDRLIILFEGNKSEAKAYNNLFHNKIDIIYINTRPTYQDMIDYANEHLKNCYIILANADICFDSNSNIERIIEIENSKLWALTRYNYIKSEDKWILEGKGKIGSYDSYLFQSPLKVENVNFTIGILGCDTLFLQRIIENKIAVCNPSFSIISKHIHNDSERNPDIENEGKTFNYWSVKDFAIGGQKLYCPSPTKIEDYKYLNYNWRTDFRIRIYKTSVFKLLRKIKILFKNTINKILLSIYKNTEVIKGWIW